MKDRRNKTLIVIVGPTGSGKTGLAIAVAKHFGASIISTDSRQVFRGMPIGTAQPSEEQMAEVRHYFIASHDITEHYTAGKYEEEALALLDRLFADGDLVVAVGGSGLYIDALCYGMDELPDVDPELRRELAMRLEKYGLENLLSELEEKDPAYYAKVDRSNPQRIMRALEVALQTGRPYSAFRSGTKCERDFGIVKIGTLLPREELYDRINRRVDAMVVAGLENEARSLYPYRELNSLQTVGYREFFDYFDGIVSREEAIELIKRNSRRYAKRQMTWFGRDEEIKWFAPDAETEIISYIESIKTNLL